MSVKTYIGAEMPNCLAPLDGKRAHMIRMATEVGMHQLTFSQNRMGALKRQNSRTNVHTFVASELHVNAQSDKMYFMFGK